jgi:Nuclear transport factor 2 (NTF2) domain
LLLDANSFANITPFSTIHPTTFIGKSSFYIFTINDLDLHNESFLNICRISSFYNQHSSFTHGGLDPDPSKDDVLIIGQKNIHDKIQQLNFRDCHAKISYVDAQATLGDGVVVQVSGELSNDGHPMRRFTQTFVLACQSPKKYYVHNDIFRYQDMYNEDDDAVRAGDDHDANDLNAANDSTGSMIVPQNATVFYQAPSNVVVNNPAIIPNFPPQAGPVNGMHDEMLKNISTQTTQSPQQILNAQATLINQVAQTIPMAPAPTSLPLPVEPVAVIAPEAIPIMADNNMYDGDQSIGECGKMHKCQRSIDNFN